jgi:AcrR family transcriptional regulator
MATLKRNRILDEALDLVLREGVRRFSASELARRLGVVKAALYHHFPGGKGEIVNAVFEREEDRLLAASERAVAAAEDTRGRLLAIGVTSVRELVRLARLYRIDEEIVDEIHGWTSRWWPPPSRARCTKWRRCR